MRLFSRLARKPAPERVEAPAVRVRMATQAPLLRPAQMPFGMAVYADTERMPVVWDPDMPDAAVRIEVDKWGWVPARRLIRTGERADLHDVDQEKRYEDGQGDE